MNHLLLETERFRFIDWGMREYHSSVQAMKDLVKERSRNQGKDAIFFVEHDPVITMGRRARKEHLVGPPDPDGSAIAGIPVVISDRGGDVTLHSPGQLVIYPVIALTVREQRLHDLLKTYEELVIRCCGEYSINAFRIPGKTGAWTQRGKLASIGIHLERWITYHGIALNVSNDLSLFDHIIPCGLKGIKMTSLELEAGRTIDIKEVKEMILKLLPKVWDDFKHRAT